MSTVDRKPASGPTAGTVGTCTGGEARPDTSRTDGAESGAVLVSANAAALSSGEMGSAVAHVARTIAARERARAILESCVEPRLLTELDAEEQLVAELWAAGFLIVTEDGRVAVAGTSC